MSQRAPGHPGSFPGPFVGRRAELDLLKRLVRTRPLVTVTGMGGIGKSRLAAELCAEAAGSFPGGTWRADLSEISDGRLVAPTVASAVGLRDQGGSGPEALLADHFTEEGALLVLDGCDGVVDACADLVAGLNDAVPGLRIVATSRTPLHVVEESIVALTGMDAPDPARAVSVDVLRAFDATALYLARSGLPTRAETPVAARECRQVAALCERLEGLPLAIELAAEATRVMSTAELLARLDRPYELLEGSQRDVPARHRSLELLVRSMEEACTPEERRLWACFAAFRGPVDLSGLERVGTGRSPEEPRVVDLVALRGLVDKSIVSRRTSGEMSWYRLSPLLRDYAMEHLGDPEEHARLREAHLRWCLWIGERAQDFMMRPVDGIWVERTIGNHLNLQSALEYCLEEASHVRDGLELVSRLGTYWSAAGRLTEGREWHRRFLAAPGDPSAERMHALRTAAMLAALDGDGAAEELATEATASAATIGAAPSGSGLPVDASWVSGLLALNKGEVVRAEACFTEGLASGDAGPGAVAQMVQLASLSATLGGAPARAERLCADCLESGSIVDDLWSTAYLELAIAVARSRTDAPMSARAIYAESVRDFAEFRDVFAMRWCLAAGVLILFACGRMSEAAVALGAASAHPFGFLARPLSDPIDRAARGLRAGLGEAEFARLTQWGADLSLGRALAVAAGGLGAADAVVEGGDGEREEDPLSPREREVARLVADGLTNKDIAAELFVSVRTVDGHVHHVLTKLGLGSRTQLAAWMIRQDARRDA